MTRQIHNITPPKDGDPAPCPACGRPLPEEPERYTLRRDGEPVVYCPQCGAEWGVQDA